MLTIHMRQKRNVCAFLPYFLAISLSLICDVVAQAAKAVNVKIQHNGKPILETILTVDDRANPSEAWFTLSDAPLKAKGMVPTDPSEPLQAILTGDIQIDLAWAGSKLAHAQVDSLRLVRSKAEDDHWLLPREETERTALAAGLSLPDKSFPIFPVIVAVVVFVAVIGVVLWLIFRSRREHKAPDS